MFPKYNICGRITVKIFKESYRMKTYNFIRSEDRRFRHLHNVHIRNLDTDSLIHSKLSFHCPKDRMKSEKNDESEGDVEFGETPIFESDPCENSINPSFDIEWHNPRLKELSGIDSLKFSIHLYELDEDMETKSKEIFNEVVDFSEMTFFSESMNSISFLLPLNTVIFEFIDGCYLSNEFVEKNIVPCKDPSKIKCSGGGGGGNNDNRFNQQTISVTLVGGAIPSPLPEPRPPISFPSSSNTNNDQKSNSTPGQPTSLPPQTPHSSNSEHDEVFEVPVSIVNVSDLERNIQEILELRSGISNLDHKIGIVKSRIREKLEKSRDRKQQALEKQIMKRRNEETKDDDDDDDDDDNDTQEEEEGKKEEDDMLDPLLKNEEFKEIPSKLQMRTTDRLQKLIKEKRESVKRLKMEIETHKKRLVTLEEIFLMSQKYVLLHTKKMREKKRAIVPEYEKNLSLLQKKLRQRRGELVSEIFENIYLVRVLEKPREKVYKYTINGLGIYKYERARPGATGLAAQGRLELSLTDETAAALGYVSHCVVMVSKILEIPLIYRLIPKSSRSLIVDSNDPNHSFLPLYPPKSKNERQHFYKAVKYLNENIVGLTEKLRAGRMFEIQKSERRKQLFEEFKKEQRIIRTKKIDFDRVETNVIKNLNKLYSSCKEILR